MGYHHASVHPQRLGVAACTNPRPRHPEWSWLVWGKGNGEGLIHLMSANMKTCGELSSENFKGSVVAVLATGFLRGKSFGMICKVVYWNS